MKSGEYLEASQAMHGIAASTSFPQVALSFAFLSGKLGRYFFPGPSTLRPLLGQFLLLLVSRHRCSLRSQMSTGIRAADL
jgi:hypothetical protein